MKLSAIKELIREIEIDHPGKDLDLAIPVCLSSGLDKSNPVLMKAQMALPSKTPETQPPFPRKPNENDHPER